MNPEVQKIVIGTYLEPELIEQIKNFDRDVSVFYEPELLPPPRYKCDHTGKPRDLSRAQLQKWLEITSQADVFFDFDWYKPESIVERAPQLQWIQATSAGIGSFMRRTGLDQSPVTVTTAGGIHAIPLAEFSLMGALHFIKGVPLLNQWKSDHHWERFTTRQLSGLRLLVIGLGGIGRKVASTFSGLGVDVWGLGRTGIHYDIPHISRIIGRSQLLEVLPEIDIVVVCCPLTSETNGMIGATELSLLKQGAVLVNISRGQVVDEGAMIEKLKEGGISGACLDVFFEEPLPPEHPLWDLPNVIVSPHSASTVATENESLVRLFCDNLERIKAGRPPRNLYRANLGY